MSVEALLGSRAGRIMAETISVENKGSYKKSPVYLSGAAFWRQGREGLREITAGLKQDEVDFGPEKDIRDLPEKYRRSADINYTACVFGISMIFNERALIEKEVNPKHLALAYNISFCETIVPPIYESEEEVEKLSEVQYKSLLSLVDIKHPDKANRSLSRLYTDRIDLMPPAIKRILDESGTLPIITKVFLPRHDWLVTELIIQNAKEMSEMRR